MTHSPDGKVVTAVVCPLCHRPALRHNFDGNDIGIIECDCVKDWAVVPAQMPQGDPGELRARVVIVVDPTHA